jgi:hypothetical protein
MKNATYKANGNEIEVALNGNADLPKTKAGKTAVLRCHAIEIDGELQSRLMTQGQVKAIAESGAYISANDRDWTYRALRFDSVYLLISPAEFAAATGQPEPAPAPAAAPTIRAIFVDENDQPVDPETNLDAAIADLENLLAAFKETQADRESEFLAQADDDDGIPTFPEWEGQTKDQFEAFNPRPEVKTRGGVKVAAADLKPGDVIDPPAGERVWLWRDGVKRRYTVTEIKPGRVTKKGSFVRVEAKVASPYAAPGAPETPISCEILEGKLVPLRN